METTLPVFNSPCPQQGNAVKDFIAERRKPSGEFMTLTHRRARALPLKIRCCCGEKSFTVLPARAKRLQNSDADSRLELVGWRCKKKSEPQQKQTIDGKGRAQNSGNRWQVTKQKP